MADPWIGFASMDWSRIPDGDGHPTPGGSGWYRCHLPHRALLAAGVDSVIGRLIADRNTGRLGIREWGGGDHFDCGLVNLQRWMLDELPYDIRRAQGAGQRIINDVDDWFFGLATQNLASRSLNSDPRSNLNHYRRVLAVSDLVTTSTPYLAERLSAFLPHVRLVRNHIDLEEGRWPRVPQRQEAVLGWAGATPWRSGDLETLRGVVAPLCGRLGVRFHHAGHMGGDWPSAGEVLGLPGEMCSATPMAPIHEWPDQFAHFDVGIVPLSDRPFNLAKSAIKGMEYVAAGKPYVAQATPEYQRLAGLGVGRVARRPREWSRHLGELLGMSAAEREEEAERNRNALLETGLTTDRLAEHWLEVAAEGLGASIPSAAS